MPSLSQEADAAHEDDDAGSDVTPHHIEDGDGEDSDSEEEEAVGQGSSLSMGECILQTWNKRATKLEHDYAIAGWCFCVLKEVREDVKENMTQEHHLALERVVKRLHVPPCPNKSKRIAGMKEGEIVDRFWDEFQTFKKESPPFDSASRWNSQHALQGKSHLWHEKYSLPYTDVLGFVACRVTSKTLGVGPCERNWAAVKNVKTGKRQNLGGDSVERRSILYSTALINEARLHREANEKIDAEGPTAMFCDDNFK